MTKTKLKIGILNILHKILSGIGDLSILKDRLRTKLGSIYSISTYSEINPLWSIYYKLFCRNTKFLQNSERNYFNLKRNQRGII